MGIGNGDSSFGNSGSATGPSTSVDFKMDGGAMGGMPGMGLNLNNIGTTLDYLNTNGHAQFLPNAQVNIKDMVGGNQSYLVFGGLQNLEENHEEDNEHEERERDLMMLREEREREGDL